MQHGAPLSTPSALAYVVGEHGQGKGCLNLPSSTLTAGSSGAEPGGQTLSLGQRVWGCQGSASLEPLLTAPASADPCEEPWQGKGSSTVSSRTCRVSVPTTSLPACSLCGTSHPGHARSLLAPKSWAVGGVTARCVPENPHANPATAACSHPHCQPLGTSSAQEVAVLLAPPAPLLLPKFLFLFEEKEGGILPLSTAIRNEVVSRSESVSSQLQGLGQEEMASSCVRRGLD